jgi:hypothetical protein
MANKRLEYKFGDLLKFSEEWFKTNQASAKDKKWVTKNRIARMIAAGTHGNSVTVVKAGTRYAHNYHVSFLTLVNSFDKTRRETARQIFDWCEDKWIKEFPNRGKLEDYIEWIKLKSCFLKES